MERRDEELMGDVQAGQLVSFEELVARYRRPLLRLALSKIPETTAAEDVVQETFLAVFAARHTFRTDCSFRTWLWTIALNLCKRHGKRLRTAQDFSRHQQAERSGQDRSASPPGLQRLLLLEQSEQLRRAMDELPEYQADALRLRFFGGLKFEEIAAAMQSSVSAAKVRVKQGLLRLASLLPAQEELES